MANGLLLTLAAIGAVLALMLVSAMNARAEDDSQTCDELQIAAKHQLERDAPLQSALWRRYDHMLRNLMRPMNARLALNGHSIFELAKVADDFAGELLIFESTFDQYRGTAEDFLIMRCDDTVAEVAREISSLRENMASSKLRLDHLLEMYRDIVVAESEGF
jgi:hypothetical protein